jgi:SPP1 family phage portal protein
MLYEELKKLITGATSGSAGVESISDLIEVIKDTHNRKYPDVEKYKKQYDPKTHGVMDETIRKNKRTREAPKKESVPLNPNDPQSKMVTREVPGDYTNEIELVNRIAIPLQKKIVDTRVNFAFGKPVTLEAKLEESKDADKTFMEVLNKVFKKNKIDTVNREFAREAHRATRVAECWFLAPGPDNMDYGAKVRGKLRVVVWKPWEGDMLYPFFDDYNDMIAFGRGYKTRDKENREEEHFEIYTVDEKIHFENTNESKGWRMKQDGRAKNPYGKIPIIYTEFPEPAWTPVETMIDRLENMISDLGDTNQYHASPKILMTGNVQSVMKKGETGGLLKMDKDSDAKYLSWDNAPESLKVEAEFLLRFVYSMTNTPDMSFEQMNKMTNPSGETMKMLFMDAILQVLSDSEKWNDWQERRLSLVKTIINTTFEGMSGLGQFDIEPQINPFLIQDVSALISNVSSATGGAVTMSQKTGVQMLHKAGLVEDVELELEQINNEGAEADKRAIAKEQQMQTASFPE